MECVTQINYGFAPLGNQHPSWNPVNIRSLFQIRSSIMLQIE